MVARKPSKNQEDWGPVSALPFTKYVNLVMSLNFFGPPFFFFQQLFYLTNLEIFQTQRKVQSIL